MSFLSNRLILPILLWWSFVPILGQEVSLVAGPTQQVGPYRVSLRLPAEGLAAGAEQQLEMRLVDTSKDDPVLGPPPVIRATVQANLSMPLMPAMPQAEELAHPEGVPGEYGLHPTFAHGGDYVLKLTITPPRSATFTVEFPLNVADTPRQRAPRPLPFRLELQTQPGKLKAGAPARLHLRVWGERELRDAAGRPNGKRQWAQLNAFETVHEKLLHLIIVRRDLDFFAHTHPTPQDDGAFVLPDFVFPTAGAYELFADTAPRGAGAQVLHASLEVTGKTPPASAPLATASRETESTVAGARLSIADNSALPARKTSVFTVTLRHADSGAPLDDLQPYLGALGHLLMIHADAQTFVHAHPDEREPLNGRQGRLRFLARPPKAGLYRAWIEFQRGGSVQRAAFIVEAQEADNAKP